MTTAAAATKTLFTIDPVHSEVGFSVKHLMISTVKGSFTRVSGEIVIDPADFSNSTVTAEIDAASIDTRSEQRDAHLRSADFFDVEQYPTLTFASRRIERTGPDRFRAIGDLTIRDVTREVVLEVEELGTAQDPWGGTRAGYSASTKVDRTEFGLTWNAALETGGVVVGNEIRISLEIQAVQA